MCMSVDPAGPSTPDWTFLSNYGHVLVCLALDPQARLRDIAARVGITERAVQGIVRSLEHAGYVHKERVGRRNTYAVEGDQPFRHTLESGVAIGDFLRLVAGRDTGRTAGTVPVRQEGGDPGARESGS